MNYSESTKAVFERIQDLDPDNVSKIIGYLLLKGYDQLEMIRLAFGPDCLILSLIEKVKRDLINSSPNPSQISPPKTKLPTKFTPFTPSSSRTPENGQWNFPLSGQWNIPLNGQWNIPLNVPTYHPLVHNFQQYLVANNYCPHIPEPSGAQICDNFRQGYCKYGGGCKFLHVLGTENGGYMVLNPPNEANIDRAFSRGSIRQLEMEITELLKLRRGIPVSISSLPILYYDRYDKPFMVEGYLREAKCSLPQLLAYMTKCIRIIDRPHGRQSIILADDIHRYKRFIEERYEDESVAPNISCQVYLTFLPECNFCDEDIYEYFDYFGPVREVRIPNLDKRMYGFVTFAYPETAALVLTKTNPHVIGGGQIVVKPYRRTIVVDRKTAEKVEHAINNAPNPVAGYMPSSIELETKPISETDHTSFSQSSDSSTLLEGVVSNSSTSEDKLSHVKMSNNKPESFEELNLPDSPFAYEAAEF